MSYATTRPLVVPPPRAPLRRLLARPVVLAHAVVAALGVVVLAGCVPAAGPGDGPRLVTGPEDAPRFVATLTGEVAVAQGCVVVRDGEGGRLVLPLFPPGGAEWHDGALRYGGATYAVGGRIELTGGEVTRDGSPALLDEVDLPETCADLPLFSVSG